MNRAKGEIVWGRTIAPTRSVFFKNCWCAFQDWRKSRKLKATLHQFSDFELKDIGITRGEIDYLASLAMIERPDIISDLSPRA